MKKFNVGEIVVDLKTGEIGKIFYADVGCEAVIANVDGDLQLWMHKNIDKYAFACIDN